ncbi:MAG TPA: hypothetical protein VFE90_04120 [Myxococcales bacterium]|nr:hypothetical protein [Myxococcales bacterium]
MALLAVLAPAPRAPAPLEVTLREPALEKLAPARPAVAARAVELVSHLRLLGPIQLQPMVPGVEAVLSLKY